VAMSLSKIYRGTEANGLKEFQFRSFGETEPNSPLEADGFIKSSSAPVPPAPAGHSVKDVEAAYARGRQEVLDSAENNLETAAQAFAAAAEEISRVRDSVARSSGKDMLRLVMAISEQVIRREMAADPEIVLSIIENALQSSVRTDQYRIRINPADLEAVTQHKPLFLASISGLKNLSIETDPEISPGGCRVDSDLGDVDATIETQLATIRQSLSEAISSVE
jgi:flagellar assembly protein FliH